MNKELKQWIIAAVVLAVAYYSMYLFYYVSKYLNYI